MIALVRSISLDIMTVKRSCGEVQYADTVRLEQGSEVLALGSEIE